MQVPNRFYNGSDYRYGFQGQEKDNEIKGQGNSLNYTFRMHDPRIGRFFAIDPLAKKYPHYSPYSFSGNKVIAHKELEGLEDIWIMNQTFENGATMTSTLYKDDVNYEVERANYAKLANIDIKNLPTEGVIDTQVNYNHSGSTVLGIRSVSHSGLTINSDQRNWGEMADDWIASKRGNAAHEGEDWIDSFNVGGKYSTRTKAGKTEYELGIYSTHENSAGFYMKTTISTGLIIDKKGGKDHSLPSMPSLSLFAKANTKNSFGDPYIKQDVKTKVSGSFKLPDLPVNITVDREKSLLSGKKNYSFGIEGGINVKPKLEASGVHTTTILNTTKEINLNGG